MCQCSSLFTLILSISASQFYILDSHCKTPPPVIVATSPQSKPTITFPRIRISLESDATWRTNKPTGYLELSPRGNLSPTRRGEITNSLPSSSSSAGTCLQSRLCPQSVYIISLLLSSLALLWSSAVFSLQFSGQDECDHKIATKSEKMKISFF